jgi:hypothetical protein
MMPEGIKRIGGWAGVTAGLKVVARIKPFISLL